MHNKKELKILSKSMDLAQKIYQLTTSFPKEEIFGLTSQIKRNAVSIPSNIGEGAGRNSNAEFIHFLSIANGSSFELEVQLKLSERFGFISTDDLISLTADIEEVQKMNYKFQEYLVSKK